MANAKKKVHIKITEPKGKAKERTPNPPRTTKGKITAPKFGSAGSGGLELEPGPEAD